MRLFILLVAMMPLAMHALQARAAMVSPCENPMVLAAPKVQVFLVPYEADSQLTDRGRELATLVQRHVLYAALKYQSIAVEELTDTRKSCSAEFAAARVIPQLKAGQTAIFLRGRLFEQASQLRLQTTVAFLTPGQTDTITWQMDGTSAHTSATFPSDPILFAPRAIPLSLLDVLQSAQVEARRLHKAPDPDSPFQALPSGPDARYGFEVLGSDKDWMHVRLFPQGLEGWVPAHTLASGDELKGTFPELYFVDGLIGYNELKALSDEQNLPSAQDMFKAMAASLNRYLELSGGRAESETRALAAILKANAQWRIDRVAKSPMSAVEAVWHAYRSAELMAPTSTIGSHFVLASALALCADGQCNEGADELHTQFLAAVARDPTNKELLGNLDLLYDAAASGKLTLQLPKEAIVQKRDIVTSALQSLH